MVSTGQQDSLLTAILMWIPVEVITSYKVIMGLIPADYGSGRLWTSILAIPITALWIAFATRTEGRKVAWRQVILAPLAFTCWVVAIQEDVMKGQFPDWELWMGSVVLGVGTLVLPILDGILRSLGITQN
jgi:hypothetical protein